MVKWYKKEVLTIIQENKYLVLISCIFSFLFLFVLYYFIRTPLWVDLNPIPEPTLTLRMISALGFIGLGRLLYYLKFYLILYIIMVGILRNKKLYKDLKKVIWDIVSFITGFLIVPFIIDILNTIINYGYNIIIKFLYILPIFFVPVITFLVIYLLNILIKSYKK